MRTIDNLLRQFAGQLEGVHAARVRLVFAAVCAALRADRISLTSIGRAIAERTAQKHGIKRMDRLLGNRELWGERLAFYGAIARRLVAPSSRPSIIVDWTSLTTTMWTLNAALPVDGRALVIYSESYPISRYLKPAINRRFLRNLREVLPPGCVPVIVTDAGFRTPWMRAVRAMGWDYVCRLRGQTHVRKLGEVRWLPLRCFFSMRAQCAQDFGTHEVGRKVKVGHTARIVCFKSRYAAKRSARGWSEKWGTAVKTDETKARRASLEPWILATSLESSPQTVVAHYQRRMQIEETFRDTKNVRFGLSMAQARTTNPRRADLLTLLATLAHVLSVLAGLIAERCQLTRHFQANTLRTRRVLSLSRLGRLVLANANATLSTTALGRALAQLKRHLKPALEPG